MQWLMRIVCIGYVVLLTMLLFTSDPTRLIGLGEELPRVLRIVLPAAHVISFFVLAVLALIPRWHVPRWQIVLILAIYGGMTEITQGFLPPRAAEWMDWCQDLAGIALARCSAGRSPSWPARSPEATESRSICDQPPPMTGGGCRTSFVLHRERTIVVELTVATDEVFLHSIS